MVAEQGVVASAANFVGVEADVAADKLEGPSRRRFHSAFAAVAVASTAALAPAFSRHPASSSPLRLQDEALADVPRFACLSPVFASQAHRASLSRFLSPHVVFLLPTAWPDSPFVNLWNDEMKKGKGKKREI